MKLFGWKSTGRASVRPAQTRVRLARRFGAMSLGEWPRSYEAQVRDGYLDNAIAQRAVRLVAEGVASAPVFASDNTAWALVAATSGGQALLETVAIHLLLHGNAYVELLPGADGVPAELYALRPERVAVEADARGWPTAFLYRAGDAVTRLAAEHVIHIRTHLSWMIITGWAALVRPLARWRSTMQHRAGTKRCSIMLPGPLARWCMRRRRGCLAISLNG